MTAHAFTPTGDLAESSKGAVAREKMLQAALVVFGQHGFDGATTRMLATEANMNLGAIPYYFGSKEDLYAQAADYLASFIHDRQADRLQQLEAQAKATTDKVILCDLVVAFLVGQAQIVLMENIPTSWMHFLLKALSDKGQAFECLNRRVIEPAQSVLTGIVGRIIGRSHDDPVTRTVAFLGIHQALYIRLADSMLMQRMGWDQITPERIDALLQTIGQAIRAQLLHYPSPPASA